MYSFNNPSSFLHYYAKRNKNLIITGLEIQGWYRAQLNVSDSGIDVFVFEHIRGLALHRFIRNVLTFNDLYQ